jgi:DNA-binding response OmpR family regulator
VTKRLLIIDDEETILFAFERYFRRQGFVVHCARELEEAEALTGYGCYDLVIVDLSLTGQGTSEGLEIVRFVRRNCPASRLILLTAFATPEVETEAMERGADAFLRKPQPLSEIAQLAQRLLGAA